MATKSFTFHTDPGHGWLEVPYAALADVGLGCSCFSQYSYYSERLQAVFLEEDCDAPKFFAAYSRHNGGAVPIIPEKHHAGDCFVRRLPRLQGIRV